MLERSNPPPQEQKKRQSTEAVQHFELAHLEDLETIEFDYVVIEQLSSEHDWTAFYSEQHCYT